MTIPVHPGLLLPLSIALLALAPRLAAGTCPEGEIAYRAARHAPVDQAASITIAQYLQAVEACPGNVVYQQAYARQLWAENHGAKALAEVDAFLQQNPREPHLLYLRAEILRERALSRKHSDLLDALDAALMADAAGDSRARDVVRDVQAKLGMTNVRIVPAGAQLTAEDFGNEGRKKAAVRPKLCFYNIQFDLNDDQPNAASLPQLEQLAAGLANLLRESDPPRRVSIAGHADLEPKTGASPAESQEWNLRLSERRAAAVVEHLRARVAKLLSRDLPASLFVPSGHGSGEPIDPRVGEPAGGRNRRVEVSISLQDDAKSR